MTDSSGESLLRDRARFLVALGYHDFETVIRQCTQILDEPSEADERLARQIVGEEFAAHLADQETWPEELDTDRLHRAFRELDMSGIVARLDHTCCQNCGISELGEEVPRGEDRRGYVFAHRQDMEDAVPGGSLALSYGVIGEGRQPPEAQVEIGREVAAALRRHDLEVDWNGTPQKRIGVSLTWRRRRLGRLAAWPGGEPAPSEQPLSISYCDMPRVGVENAWLPASFQEARDVLLTMAPYTGNYINFKIPAGGGLIAAWGPGPALTFELPGDEDSGRDVTITEAEEILSVLAHEGRIALGP
ncbi:hypothetical protein [Actinomadura sp. 7K507]|uniref:DUF6891 domain-containing protein n=1 Tax=Actinomadura sp. 7K507 TaxID=2530365 RepID=UPI00104C82F1|nr:hypothetical protein [Actinomadura sp. 7K507]TDC80312.1 hypothetical protein E1285_34995 [Actinomadura sp. 7K507]